MNSITRDATGMHSLYRALDLCLLLSVLNKMNPKHELA